MITHGETPTLHALTIASVSLEGLHVSRTTCQRTYLPHSLIRDRDILETREVVISWQDLLAAACQEDVALARVYAEMACASFPRVEQAHQQAYRDYCGQGATTRSHEPGSPHVIGHGSWVQGPDPVSQDRWMAWRAIEENLRRLAAEPMAQWKRQP